MLPTYVVDHDGELVHELLHAEGEEGEEGEEGGFNGFNVHLSTYFVGLNSISL
jgi:hypothetical protein